MSEAFSKVPNWFYDEAVPALGLKAAHVAAYGVIVRHADKDGICWPSLDLIGHEGGMSRPTAGAAVRTLAAHGLIKVMPGKRSSIGRPSNQYQVREKPALPVVPVRKRRSIASAAAGTLDSPLNKGLDKNTKDIGQETPGTLDNELVLKKTHRTRPTEGSACASPDALASATQGDDPSSTSKSERSARTNRWTPLPDGFAPNNEHHDEARKRGVSLIDELASFRNYHLANGSRKVDWDAELLLWLGRSRPGSARPGRGKAAGELMNEVLAIKLPGEHGYSGESVA